MSEDSTSIYRAALLEHARDQRFRGPLEGATLRGRALNPLCGDELVAEATAEAGGALSELRYTIRGCAIAQASAHLVAQHASGHSPAQLAEHAKALRAALEGEELPPALEAMRALLVIRTRRSRHACALLPWQALAELEQV